MRGDGGRQGGREGGRGGEGQEGRDSIRERKSGSELEGDRQSESSRVRDKTVIERETERGGGAEGCESSSNRPINRSPVFLWPAWDTGRYIRLGGEVVVVPDSMSHSQMPGLSTSGGREEVATRRDRQA